jgi:hypothetical protein
VPTGARVWQVYTGEVWGDAEVTACELDVAAAADPPVPAAPH